MDSCSFELNIMYSVSETDGTTEMSEEDLADLMADAGATVGVSYVIGDEGIRTLDLRIANSQVRYAEKLLDA